MKHVIIEGMACRNCAAMIEEALCRIDEIEKVRVDVEDGYADVIGAVSDEKLTEVINDLGYKVVDITIE
jgi:copper chaperone